MLDEDVKLQVGLDNKTEARKGSCLELRATPSWSLNDNRFRCRYLGVWVPGTLGPLPGWRATLVAAK